MDTDAYQSRHYVVEWDIDLDAVDPMDAAVQALCTMRDPESIATVVRVTDPASAKAWLIDVEDPDKPYLMKGPDPALELVPQLAADDPNGR